MKWGNLLHWKIANGENILFLFVIRYIPEKSRGV